MEEITLISNLADKGVVGLLIMACAALWTFLQKQTFKIQEQLFRQLESAENERKEEIKNLLGVARSIEQTLQKLPHEVSERIRRNGNGQ